MERIPDKTFPVLAWHPSGEMLTYIFEKRANAWIGSYTLAEKKHTEKELYLIEKINSMHYSPDGKRMILSAVNRGQTDLYLYQVVGNNFERLTNDIWDDLDPSFIEGGKRIIFTSNRVDDTLRTTSELLQTPRLNKDVFIFNLENREKLLERVTSSPTADETLPFEYSGKYYSFLSDDNGYRNRMVAYIDSAISAIDTAVHYRYFTVAKPVSAFKRDVHDYEFNGKSGNYMTGFRRAGQPWIVFGNKEFFYYLNVLCY
jgi:Tol biopolymer transport system component